MATNSNFIVKLTDCSRYGMDRREPGNIVYGCINPDGSVIFFDPAVRKGNKVIKAVFDIVFDSVEEAKKYGTCLSKTDFDVKSAWDKMMSDRYW